MSLAIENFSVLLSKQYNELPCGANRSTQTYKVTLESKEILVSVVLQRIKNPSTDTGEHKKSYKNEACIQINPLDAHVQEIVIDHFQSQIEYDSYENGGNESIFDSVTINDVPLLI